MNWGKGIIIGMGLFMTFIITLITIIMSNRVDLVSEDYYQKEITFEKDINAKTAWNKLNQKVAFQSNEEHVIVNLPKIEGVSNYDLQFSRPNDNKEDLRFKIEQTQTYLIEKNKLKPGLYEYEISCKRNGENLLKTGKYYVK
jgi:hypothetical protein